MPARCSLKSFDVHYGYNRPSPMLRLIGHSVNAQLKIPSDMLFESGCESEDA